MRLIMCERQDLETPEVTIAYREMTTSVQRVSEYVRNVERTIFCKKDNEEYSILINDIFYFESVDKKIFVYCEKEVYRSNYKLYELEEMLSQVGFVRVSKSVLLNVEKLTAIKTLVNSKLEAKLSNGESVCVTRKYLKDIKNALKDTKVRIQCVMYDVKTIDGLLEFVNTFRFADDISFRRLMKLPEKYGVVYETEDDLYNQILEYAFNNFKLVEQTIQDYYVYEIWNYDGIDITFSYSNMNMLNNVESMEDDRVCREFIIHPNGIISGSWDFNNKVISV